MRKEDIIELDDTRVDHSIIGELQNSEYVNYLMCWCDGECNVILKDGTSITVYLKEENKNDKTANT